MPFTTEQELFDIELEESPFTNEDASHLGNSAAVTTTTTTSLGTWC